MTKVFAWAALVSCSFAAMLGNYWLTFGLWPQSWGWFATFWVISIVLQLVFEAMRRE